MNNERPNIIENKNNRIKKEENTQREASFEEKNEASGILKKLMSNPRVRKLVFASLVTFFGLISTQSEAQNVNKDLTSTKIENVNKDSTSTKIENKKNQLSLEQNYMMQDILISWINWFDTNKFVDPSDHKIEMNVSLGEMEAVYKYLQTKIDLDDYSTLAGFMNKLPSLKGLDNQSRPLKEAIDAFFLEK